ncbi:hypothetical protein NN561_005491 [Cricetulus griseus]
MASRASGVHAGTREWVSAARSPSRGTQSGAAVIGPARHVGGQRASLPATRNPLPALRPACTDFRDKGTSRDPGLREGSASQPHWLADRARTASRLPDG